jgi:hypothetical protein
MKQLSKLQSALFLFGGVLMVIGAGLFAFQIRQDIASWIFLCGTVFFTLMQMMQTYEGTSMVMKRLKRIQGIADLFFIISGISMVDTANHFFVDLFDNYHSYIAYCYNKWVVFLLIAAILEVYTTHRMSSELKKEEA